MYAYMFIIRAIFIKLICQINKVVFIHNIGGGYTKWYPCVYAFCIHFLSTSSSSSSSYYLFLAGRAFKWENMQYTNKHQICKCFAIFVIWFCNAIAAADDVLMLNINIIFFFILSRILLMRSICCVPPFGKLFACIFYESFSAGTQRRKTSYLL